MDNFSNLKEMLNKSAQIYNNKILYIRENISYKEFLYNVNCLGTSLISMGKKNKRIAILSENRYEWELAFFAITCGVGTVVPIDKSLPKGEIIRIINRSNVDTIFCSDNYKNVINEIRSSVTTLKTVISFDSKEFQSLLFEGRVFYCVDKRFVNARINDKEPNFIFFTSGTTDYSKAVMLSQKNVCYDLYNVSKVFDITEKDNILALLSLNHVLEGIFCLLLSIYKGASRVHCNKTAECVDYIKKYNITFLGATPRVYEKMLKRFDELKLYAPNINMFMSGGASLNKDIQTKYIENGITLIQGYGMTETGPVISIESKKNNKIGSVGKAIPGVKVKIINKDKDGIGEILVKGDNVALGYLNSNDKSKFDLENGWLHTGDLGIIDDDGYIYIRGRLKNIIVLRNGKKIYPEELEFLINEIPGVIENMVYGITTKDNGYKICTNVVYDKNKFKINDELKIKEIITTRIEEINDILPDFKQIREINITDKELEKTVSGKIKRIKYFEN